jgi:hypothetical protein
MTKGNNMEDLNYGDLLEMQMLSVAIINQENPDLAHLIRNEGLVGESNDPVLEFDHISLQ